MGNSWNGEIHSRGVDKGPTPPKHWTSVIHNAGEEINLLSLKGRPPPPRPLHGKEGFPRKEGAVGKPHFSSMLRPFHINKQCLA